MRSNDAEIRQSGDLSSALQNATSYYQHLFSGRYGFGEKDREALEIVSLVDRIGYRDDLAGELDALCALVARDPTDVRERIEKIRERTGFISSAGRFYSVTPEPIGMIAFESAWRRWIGNDSSRFLSDLPESLVERFHTRVAGASQEVGAVVGRFFREWAIENGPRIFASESKTRRFISLVAADPENQVPLLRRAAERATPEQLGRKPQERDAALFPFGAGFGTRRLLVSISEELAQFREFFGDAEAILYKLAQDETEPSIGNNATSTWKTLFRVLLSGTELPFDQRYQILRQRFSTGDPKTRQLAISAAAMAVDQRAFRLVGPPLFGRRLPPEDWRPKTNDEYLDAVRNCVDLLRDGAFDPDVNVAKASRDSLLEAVGHLLYGGVVDPLRESLEDKVPADMRPRLASLIREMSSRMSGGRVGSQALPSTAALEAWLSSLKSRTLHERLVEDLGGAPWSHHYEEAQWLERSEEARRGAVCRPRGFTRRVRLVEFF